MLLLGTTPCSADIVFNDDGAPDCVSGFFRSEILNQALCAGTYYLTVTGALGNSGRFGVDISCTSGSGSLPCDSSPPLPCCPGNAAEFLSAYGPCGQYNARRPGNDHAYCSVDVNQNDGNFAGCRNGRTRFQRGCTDPNNGLLACQVCTECADRPCSNGNYRVSTTECRQCE